MPWPFATFIQRMQTRRFGSGPKSATALALGRGHSLQRGGARAALHPAGASADGVPGARGGEFLLAHEMHL
jgi:hypothetical protein